MCQIARKAVMHVTKKDLKKVAGALQVCLRQETGTEVHIHTMFDLYQQE